MTYLGYDPGRLLALRARATAATDALRSVRCSDPAATAAMATVRSVTADLEGSVLPLLARIIASDALLSWYVSVAGSSLGADGPTDLTWARHTAGIARAVLAGDVEPEDLRTRLATGGGAALAMTFVELGGADTAALLLRLGDGSGDVGEALATAAAVRSALATVTQRTTFPAGFAGQLVDGFVATFDDEDAAASPALTYLLDGPAFGTTFLVELTRRVVTLERAASDDGIGFWPWGVGSAYSTTFVDHGDDDRYWVVALADDPMYALLDALADDGAAGRALFTDHDVAAWVFGQRNFHMDELRAVSRAAAAAAAGPDVVASAPTALLTDAAEVASAFVNHVVAQPHVDAHRLHPDVSASMATILGTHLFAAHESVLRPVTMDEPAGETVALRDASAPGSERVAALFDHEALDVATGIAVRTEHGLATARAALDLYQQERAAMAAQVLADGDLAEPSAFLEDTMVEAARLEAHFIQHAGHEAESMGRSKDDVISFWIDLASFSVGEGGEQLGRVPAAKVAVPVIAEALGPAADLAKALLVGHEADAQRAATANAEAAADQLLYVWYRQLHAAGVVDPALPATALVDGELRTWEQFQQLPAADQARVRNAIEEHIGSPRIDAGALRDAIKVEQLPIYAELG